MMGYRSFKKSSALWSVRQRGAGVIKTLLLIPVALVLLVMLVLAFYEGRKAYWDYRVREMCERDGGTRIIDKVLIDRNDAKDEGLLIGDSVVIPSHREAKPNASYYIVYESEDLRKHHPRVFRSLTSVVRAEDKKVIAEMIIYSRVGGDFPTFAHPSSTSCRDANSELIKFRSAVQIKGEMQ